MKFYQKYYNLVVVLICVAAFPVAVVASSNLNHDDSFICKFHNDQTINSKVIVCDHCSYYFDVETNHNNQFYFFVNVSFIDNQDKQEFIYQTKSFYYSPRSPPHSYI